MKDVVTCDKPWEDGSSHYTQGFPNGETRLGLKPSHTLVNS